MIKAHKLFLAVFVSAALTACGGGGTSSPASVSIASSNSTTSVNGTTAAAVVNQPFTFAAGVPDFGTTTSTTVAFTSTGASPTFAISAGGATATGATTFGSCIFTVAASTFPPGSKLATGQSVRIDPCALTTATSGGVANGSPSDREVKFVLGTLSSLAKLFSVVINANGTVTINSVLFGSVTISVTTGV